MDEKIIKKSYTEVLELVQELIKCHPMYNNEGQINAQKILCNYLNNTGWTTYLDIYSFEDFDKEHIVKKPWEYDEYYKDYLDVKKCNLYAVLDSGSPGRTLILNGHVDVDIINKNDALANTNPQLLSDKIQGRGATDMLSGLCCLASVKNYLDTIPWRGKVIFNSVVDEEIGGNGSIRACQWMQSKKLLESEYPIECVISEPSDCKVCYETQGFFPFVISLKNEIKHMNASGSEMNLSKLTNVFNELYKLSLSDERINVNVGYIQGGYDASLPIEDLIIKGIVATTAKHNNDYVNKVLLDCGVDIVSPGISIDAIKCEDNLFGKELHKGELFSSSCDASVFYSYNIPVTVFGPGSLEQAHSEKEYILLSEIERYLTLFYKCVNKYFN